MKPRSDASYRAQCPPAVLALVLAYESATKRPVTLSYMRMHALSEIARRDYTPNDIGMVVRYVKRRIAIKPKTHGMQHGFSDASIGFQNLLLDVDKFEDRLLEAREDIIKRRGRGKKPLIIQVEAGGMNTMVESEPPTPEAVAMKRVTREALLALARGLE